MFMIMEVNEHFSFEANGRADHSGPKVQEWENLMWRFQLSLPRAKPGEKRLLMEKIDRRVGSFVRERSSKLASRLNAGRKTLSCRSRRRPRLLRSESRHCSSRMRAIRTAFQTIRGTHGPEKTRQFDRNDGRLHTGGLRCAAINTRSEHETHSIWRTRSGEAGRAVG
jgi:L-rhamnose mutarotase